MAIIRWDPYRDVVNLRDRMNRLFEDMSTRKGEERDIMPGKVAHTRAVVSWRIRHRSSW